MIALMDGTTINGTLRVAGTPLVQRYNKGTGQFIPDFTALADNVKPTVILILRDISDGSVFVPQTLEWRYNDLLLSFDDSGLCTTDGFEGYFKTLTVEVSVSGTTYQLPALRIMQNLVPISGYDNDRISVSGTIEVGGNAIAFNALSKDVVIQESTGNQYDVLVSNDKGSQFIESGESLTETARIFKDGVEITDFSDLNFTYQWVKVLGSGDVNWGTSKTQVVSTDDVDNVLKLRCDVSLDGTLVASGYDEITDFSDPYYLKLNITGINGNTVKKGQTATITPVAAKRSSGEEVADLIGSWDWNIKNNKGEDFVLTSQSSATFSAASATVTYDDMVKAGMGLSGTISGTA